MPKRKAANSDTNLPGELRAHADSRLLRAVMDPADAPADIVPATDAFQPQPLVPAKSFTRVNVGWDPASANNRPLNDGTLIPALNTPFLITDEPLCAQRYYQRYPGGGVSAIYTWQFEFGSSGTFTPIDVQSVSTAYAFAAAYGTPTAGQFCTVGQSSWVSPCRAYSQGTWSPHGPNQYAARVDEKPVPQDTSRPQRGMWIDASVANPAVIGVQLSWAPTYTAGPDKALPASYVAELWYWDGNAVVPMLTGSGPFGRVKCSLDYTNGGINSFSVTQTGYYFVKFLGQQTAGGQDDTIQGVVLQNPGITCSHTVTCDCFAQVVIPDLEILSNFLTDVCPIGNGLRWHPEGQLLTKNGSFTAVQCNKKQDLIRDFFNAGLNVPAVIGPSIGGTLYSNIQSQDGSWEQGLDNPSDGEEGLYVFIRPDEQTSSPFPLKEIFSFNNLAPIATYGFPIRHNFVIGVVTIQSGTTFAGTGHMNFNFCYDTHNTKGVVPKFLPNVSLKESAAVAQIAKLSPQFYSNSMHWDQIKGWIGRNYKKVLGYGAAAALVAAGVGSIIATAGTSTPVSIAGVGSGLSAIFGGAAGAATLAEGPSTLDPNYSVPVNESFTKEFYGTE